MSTQIDEKVVLAAGTRVLAATRGGAWLVARSGRFGWSLVVAAPMVAVATVAALWAGMGVWLVLVAWLGFVLCAGLLVLAAAVQALGRSTPRPWEIVEKS